MASFHCSVKVGAKGKAAAHSDYISRSGKYVGASKYEDIEYCASANMPAWAAHKTSEFWKAADEFERANGATYREIEIALPRELTPAQRRELVEDFIKQEIGEGHAYTFAIHIPKAALEKGEQPHAHIMYSERTIDGISRDPEQYFKRYNAKNPERGGCKKNSAGTEERLLATRARWATIQNQHLAQHGHADRVDHRSLKDQGIDRRPEKHLGPLLVKRLPDLDVSALLARRAAEGELAKAQREVSSIDVSGDLKSAIADRDEKINQLNQLNQIKERNGLREAAFRSIGQHVGAASKASRSTDRARAFTESDLVTFERNVSAAHGLAGAHGRDPQGATEALGRRIAERDYARALAAACPELGYAGQILQHIGRNFQSVEHTVTAAQSRIAHTAQIRQQIEIARTLEALETIKQAAPPNSSKAKPHSAPLKTERDTSHLVYLTDADRKALAEVAMALVKVHRGDAVALAGLPGRIATLDKLQDSASRAVGRAVPLPFNVPEAERRAAAQRIAAAKADVNQQAADRDQTAKPFASVGEKLAGTYEYNAQEAGITLERHQMTARPSGLLKGKAIAQYDARGVELASSVQGWKGELAWRDMAFKEANAARVPGDKDYIERLRQLDAKNKQAEFEHTAPARGRAQALEMEKAWLMSEAEKLAPEQRKQLETGIERSRGRGMER
jgi:hypothetical protein